MAARRGGIGRGIGRAASRIASRAARIVSREARIAWHRRRKEREGEYELENIIEKRFEEQEIEWLRNPEAQIPHTWLPKFFDYYFAEATEAVKRQVSELLRVYFLSPHGSEERLEARNKLQQLINGHFKTFIQRKTREGFVAKIKH